MCQGRLGEKVGKLLGPYLRAMVPHWLLAMSDTYTPVASAASAAFKVIVLMDYREDLRLISSVKPIVVIN